MEDWKRISTADVLRRGAERVPDKTALVDGDRRVTYRELNDRATALASSLQEMGFGKGDRIAIYMKNSLELVTAFYALQELGIIVAWANPNYRIAEAQFILKNSGARAVFIFREWEGYDYLSALLGMKQELPALERIFVVGDGEGKGSRLFEDLLKRGHGKNAGAAGDSE